MGEAPGTTAKQSWAFRENEQIVPGRSAVQLLGGGIRAEAWLCWDELLHSLVVAKLLRPSFVDDDGARSALAREARTLGELAHPAIVRKFDAVLDGPRPHLVLEALDGPRVSTLLRYYGPLSPEQLVPLGLEVASALAYMHNRDYVHLDIKPRNIIMAASPRLIDLGMARTRGQLAKLTSPLGTKAYMAPEQCRAETLPMLGPPADVWGIGATLYEAVSGRIPFPPDEQAGDYPQAAGGQPPQLDRRIPPPIARIVISCLDPDPAGRPTAAGLASTLEDLFGESRAVASRRLKARIRR